MALNLSKFQFVNKIDFDKNIITKVNMVTNCQEILSKMLHDTELTDVILVAGIDGVSIPAHRLILTAASEYFSTTFGAHFKTSNTKEIRIDDLDGETLQTLINFCYTGQINISSLNVLKMLSVASTMGFDHIKSECEKHLSNQLIAKPHLCLSIHQIALKHSFNELITKSFANIGRYFRIAVLTPLFSEMEYLQLARILQCDQKFNAEEEEIFEAAMNWVKYDEDNRKQHIPDILKSIRLVHIDTEYLNEHIQPLCTTNDLLKLLTDVLFWKDLSEPKRRRLLPPEQTNARTSLVKLFVFAPDFSTGLLCIDSYCFYTNKWTHLSDIKLHGNCDNQFTVSDDENLYFLSRDRNETEKIISHDIHCLMTHTLEQMPVVQLSMCQMDESRIANDFRDDYGMIIIGQKLYILGGFMKTLEPTNDVVCYDLSTKLWIDCANMPVARAQCGVVILYGYIYVIGGCESRIGGYLDVVERYDLLQDTWSSVTSMNHKRTDAGVGVLNGKIFAIGGQNERGVLSSVESYDPESLTWTLIASLSVARQQIAVAINENRLFAIGGWKNHGLTDIVECYDEDLCKWNTLESLTIKSANCGTAII